MELRLFAERPGRMIDAFPDDYVMLDTETTGLRAGADSVLEIGAIRFRNGAEAGRFSSLLRPRGLTRRTISSFITGLTGITYEMVSMAPPAAEVMEEFMAFMGDDVIMGYNTSFDFRFLRHECNALLMRELTNDYADVLRFARFLHPEMEHHRLADMAEHFSIVNEHAHRAFSDCLTTDLCYRELRREALERYGSEAEFMKALAGSLRSGSGRRFQPRAAQIMNAAVSACGA